MASASDQLPVSEQSKKEWKARFAQPQPPASLKALVSELHKLVGDHFVTDTAMTWAREAHVSGRFASAIGASSAWIEDRPDLGVEMPNGTKEFYEITEVIEPGRRRNDEYREDRVRKSAGEDVLHTYQPDNVSSTRSALQHAADKKAKKVGNYGTDGCGLVIYLNTDLMVFDEVADEFEASLRNDTEVAGSVFNDVWVLWSDRLYHVWNGGNAVPLSPKLGV
jgi:hypothetical protein